MKINNYFVNQRRIKVNRTNVAKNSGLTYACIYRYSLENAMVNLKPSTFKVWIWLASNKPNFTVEYSPAYLSKVINISINTAKSAFNELKEKGYIVEDDMRGHLFNFYEEPQQAKKINIFKEKREFIDNDTGEILNLSFEELLNSVENEIEARQLWEDAI
jgi:DNA-binding transcriptional regulator YhcF (GntR family)